MPVDDPGYRVIAEGDDAVAAGLTLAEAFAVLEFAREHGKRHVAIVDESTGALVDEENARGLVESGRHVSVSPPEGHARSERPTDPGDSLVPCPACQDERGQPTGEALVQLASGTRVREPCGICAGAKQLDREAMARYRTQTASE